MRPVDLDVISVIMMLLRSYDLDLWMSSLVLVKVFAICKLKILV